MCSAWPRFILILQDPKLGLGDQKITPPHFFLSAPLTCHRNILVLYLIVPVSLMGGRVGLFGSYLSFQDLKLLKL